MLYVYFTIHVTQQLMFVVLPISDVTSINEIYVDLLTRQIPYWTKCKYEFFKKNMELNI